MTSTIVVMDTETTGKDHEEGAALLEVAWVPVALADAAETPEGWTVVADGAGSFLIEHEGEIPATARTVHHISPDQVRPGAPNCLPRGVVLRDILAAEEPGHMMYAFHNAPFDTKFLPELGLPVIDTLQCARHIWPDAPGYSNQALRYWLGVEPHPDLTYERARIVVEAGIDARNQVYHQEMWARVPLAPHRALLDTACTAEILRVMLRTHSPEELLHLSTKPLLLVTCKFPKHRDVPWAEVPKDYLRWMMREGVGKDDRDLTYTVRHYLGLEN